MAEVNASIPLQGRQYQIKSPVEHYSNALALQNAQQANEFNALKMSQTEWADQQARESDAAMREFFSGPQDDPSLAALARRSPAAYKAEQARRLELRDKNSSISEREAKTRKSELDRAIEVSNRGAQLLRGAVDQPSWNMMRDEYVRLAGPDAANKIPVQFDPKFRDMWLQSTLAEKDKLEAEARTRKAEVDEANNPVTLSADGKTASTNEVAVKAKSRIAAAGAQQGLTAPVLMTVPGENGGPPRQVYVQPGTRPGQQGQVVQLPGGVVPGAKDAATDDGTTAADRAQLSQSLGVPLAARDPYRGMTTRGKEKFQQDLYTKATKRLDDLDEQVQAAKTMAQQAQRFVELQGDGRFAQGRVAGHLPAFADATQEMDSITSFIVPKMREPGSGATSDFDARMFQTATIGRTKNADANKAIVAGIAARAQLMEQRAQFMRDYVTVNGHLDGADNQWRRYVEANPIFDRRSKDIPAINPQRVPYPQFFKSAPVAPSTPDSPRVPMGAPRSQTPAGLPTQADIEAEFQRREAAR